MPLVFIRKFLFWVIVGNSFVILKIQAQPLPNRYVSNVFTSWNETQNVTFSTGVPRPNPGGGFYEWITGYPLNVREYQTTAINLRMNIFTPVGDTLSKRPVIIIAFGGGFLSESKDHWSIRLLAQELTKRGFVTAVIDYRLGMNIFNADLAMRAVYRGLQDGRSAVRFFKADAAGPNLYRIDPNQIYIGGHSSGGFVALHNAYLDRDELRPVSTRAWTQNGFQVPDQLSLDSVSDNRNFNGRAKAVFNLAGALGFTEYIEEANEPILISFHSTDDETVPYESGEPFSNLLWLVVGSDLPEVHGSFPISQQANNVGLINELNTHSNRGHDVHENGTNTLHSDIVPGISEWFCEHLLRPDPVFIDGNTKVCSGQYQQKYSVRKDSAAYYDWQITGGQFLIHSVFSNQVTVLWDENAPAHTLSVTPYSYHRARGNTAVLNVFLLQRLENIWLGNDTDWSAPSSWSLGITPDYCHDVVLPDNLESTGILTLDSTAITNISSLYVGHSTECRLLSPLHISYASGIFVAGQLLVSDSVVIHNLYDENAKLLMVSGHMEVDTAGSVNVLNPSHGNINITSSGIIQNEGFINLTTDQSYDEENLMTISGIFENQGFVYCIGPLENKISILTNGLLLNEGVIEVKED
jgi:hypothetical protein